MRSRRCLLALAGLTAAVLPLSAGGPTPAFAGGEQVALSQWLSPDASLSTSGDFATDVLSDPWDFSNPEDMLPIPGVGIPGANSISVANGVLTASTNVGAELRLLMAWPHVLPWGRDGWANPIDAARYSQLTFRVNLDADVNLVLRFWRAEQGTAPGTPPAAAIHFGVKPGWQTFHFDLNDRSIYNDPNANGVWGGPITRIELIRGGVHSGPERPVTVQLDWVRLHRPDAPRNPPAGVPVPRVLTPSEEGGADYATVERGDPWDFTSMSDVGETFQVANLSTASGDLTGTTVGNDPFIGLPLGPALNTDRYHRFTADVCYAGGFSLADAPGGGMMGRVVWMQRDTGRWIETQDFVVFPGCHKVTLDMATNPPGAINDEATQLPTGWRGVGVSALRFDLNEDRGQRPFTLQNVKLADDAAFSDTYDISFIDVAGVGGTADIYVTTTEGSYAGTRIASGLQVGGATRTFTWNGRDERGNVMPNATYWVYVVMRNTAGVGTGYSTGPVRLERPVGATPSYYVPLTPARLLDTRNGQGGNIAPLGNGVMTELDVTGVGGVPDNVGATAVVMNVTVDAPTSSGFITAWPSGTPKPFVSNLNFVPGQTVPNLVTVMVGGNGKVNLYNSSGSTHLIADVVGYYSPTQPSSGGRFTPLTPARLLDTRAGVGAPAAAIGQAQAINLDVTGVGGVPASGVSGVALNVTVDAPSDSGFLTVWPTGEGRPNASTHNFVPGLTVANLVLAKVGSGGMVSIYNSAGATHVVADVIGYFSSSGGRFVPVPPQRLVDTRDGTGGWLGAMGAGESHSMAVANSSPVPPGATGVIVNVTSVDSSLQSYVTVWPTGASMPLASTLNPRPAIAVPNQAYLRVGSNGSLDAFNAYGSTNIVVDVFGYVM